MHGNPKRNYFCNRIQIGQFQWRFTVILLIEKRRNSTLAGSQNLLLLEGESF